MTRRSDRTALRRTAVLLLAVLQVGVTLLPGFGFGTPIGARSGATATLITPSGWAFAIWGPLFAGAIVYAVFQALPAQRDNALLARIGWPTAGAFLGNALWSLYVQFRDLAAPSTAIILCTLVCLLSVYRTFARHGAFTPGERFLVVLPLSALASWLTAATIVNIAATLTFYGFRPPVDPVPLSAGVVMTGGVIAAASVARGGGNPWYALVFLWALAGIYTAVEPHASIRLATILAALLVLVSAAVALARAEVRQRWFGGTATR